MDSWAQSKQLPGQFLGSTGATVLKPEELSGVDKKHQAWAKKVRFAKVDGLVVLSDLLKYSAFLSCLY